MHGFDEHGVIGPVVVVASLNGAGQQPVYRVHVALPVDHEEGDRVGRVQ